MLHPALVVPVREVLPCMRPSRLLALLRAVDGDCCICQQVLQLKGLQRKATLITSLLSQHLKMPECAQTISQESCNSTALSQGGCCAGQGLLKLKPHYAITGRHQKLCIYIKQASLCRIQSTALCPHPVPQQTCRGTSAVRRRSFSAHVSLMGQYDRINHTIFL